MSPKPWPWHSSSPATVDDAARAKRSRAGKLRRQRGETGQALALHALGVLGFLCVEPIETGWKVLWGPPNPKRGGKRAPRDAFPMEKVAADFFAVGPGGRSVRIEAKAGDDKLSLSAFKPHQPHKLTAHIRAGGLSFVAWVHGGDVALLAWPIPGLEKGSPLSWERAIALPTSRMVYRAQSSTPLLDATIAPLSTESTPRPDSFDTPTQETA